MAIILVMVSGSKAISQNVYMFGNLADVEAEDGFFEKLEEQFLAEHGEFVVVLAGDVAVKKDKKTKISEALQPLYGLIDLVGKYKQGTIVVIPGDRDWKNGGKGGEKQSQQN